jgi:hypothetical protein
MYSKFAHVAQSILGSTIVFASEIEEGEGYAEAGMRARVLSVTEREEDLWVMKVDFAPFEDFNRQFESSNFYDMTGAACLSARDKGLYTGEDEIFLPDPSGWMPTYFSLLESSPEREALLAEYETREDPLKSYAAWLEDKIIAAN